MGFDIDTDQHLEFRYLRQDQVNTQYPGKIFQTNFEITQGFNLQYIDQNVTAPWSKLLVESWYNIGHLGGATNPNETFFNTVDRVNVALENVGVTDPNFNATTNASSFSTGERLATTYGDQEETQLTVGSDIRYINQYVNENLQYTGTEQFSTGLPRSFMTDPGAFAELAIPFASYWNTTVGTRVDWIHTNLDGPLPANYPDNLGNQLAQNNVLYSFFLSNKVDLDKNWNCKFGFGQAQRPPSLTERYADGEFLSVIQSGFSRIIGSPTLAPERLWQIDCGLNANYDKFRGRLSGFYSWILNFSTFDAFPILDPSGGASVVHSKHAAGHAGRFRSVWRARFESLLDFLRQHALRRWPRSDDQRPFDADLSARRSRRPAAARPRRRPEMGPGRAIADGRSPGPPGHAPHRLHRRPDYGHRIADRRLHDRQSPRLLQRDEEPEHRGGHQQPAQPQLSRTPDVHYAATPPTPANPAGFPFVGVYSMGFTPYVGINWTY